ncbi:MAG: hypothetical protein GX220_00065 [Treponema sp.]|nr:hypothetical protein [Treponema sp.]
MNKARILRIVIPLAVAIVYFYFNPLAPRIFEDKNKIKKNDTEVFIQKDEVQVENETINLNGLLEKNDVENFYENFSIIREKMSQFKLGEIKNPTYEQVEEYCLKEGTFSDITLILNECGISSENALKKFFTITNAFGILSYEKTLKNNPKQATVIKKMAEKNINSLKEITSKKDLELVSENFEKLEMAFKNVQIKK